MPNPTLKQTLLTPQETVNYNMDYDRKTTFAGGDRDTTYSRRNTFSRAFTFDGNAIRQSVAQPFEGLARTLTEVGNRIDPDAKFTKAVIAEYSRVDKEGNEGDVPLPSGFARKFKFWKLMFFAGLVACVMGVICAIFMNIGDEIPKQWNDCDFDNDPTCGDWYTGNKWWICVTAGAGFTVGLIRWTFSYPDNLAGIFKEIQTYHVEYKWSPYIAVISAISLAGGATLGPEQAMGNVGGGIAMYLNEFIDFEDEDYDKIFVLSGMSGALGCLFPTPFLGALMIHELGEPPKTFMESTMVLSWSACIAFAVYYEMVGVTWIEHIAPNGIGLSYDWLGDPGYKSWQILTGFAIGVISAALNLGVMITIGICKQVFIRMRQRLSWNSFLKEIVPPTIGGLCIGVVNWALPATVGNGGMEFNYFIHLGASGLVSQKLLVCTGFARMFLLGVSMNCGFVGGIIFPFLTMGIISGVIMYLNYSYIPLGLCVGCFMISLPCAIVPMPFTFSALSIFVFFFGLYQTVPIFIASLTSYLIVCGTGLFKKLASRANNNNNEQASGDVKIVGDVEDTKYKQEADEFALKQYLGNTKRISQLSDGSVSSPLSNSITNPISH